MTVLFDLKNAQGSFFLFGTKRFFPTFAAGKSCTISSYRTPPGSEDSKGWS
jgi:hypothetical protein